MTNKINKRVRRLEDCVDDFDVGYIVKVLIIFIFIGICLFITFFIHFNTKISDLEQSQPQYCDRGSFECSYILENFNLTEGKNKVCVNESKYYLPEENPSFTYEDISEASLKIDCGTLFTVQGSCYVNYT